MDDSIVQHLARSQCRPQWRMFLRALADELSQQDDDEHLVRIFRNIGIRFATENALAPGETLDEAQEAMNLIWREQEWGWTLLEDAGRHLLIRHFCSPLASAFGTAARRWPAAFLEGVYHTWMQQLGAGDALAVLPASEMDAYGSIEFSLR